MKKVLPARLKIAFLFLGLILIIGTLGYILIEKWSFLDAIYMTIITLATVGFGETHPLSPAGRIFTIFLILSGLGILMFVIESGISFLLEGEFGNVVRRKKMEKQIQSLRNHYIICASGETGEYVIEEFVKTNQNIVVVTTDKKLEENLSKNNIPVIFDNPAEDEVLEKAGVKSAKGLVSVLEDDKDNLFVVLTARSLNSNLKIVTRSVDKNSVAKFKNAGADEVVLTDLIGGMRIASAMLRPAVVNFLDQMLYQSGEPLRLEEAVVSASSPLKDKSLSESNISEKTGLMVVAIKEKNTGKYIYNPKANYKLCDGDTLIVIGNSEQVKKLRSLL